MCGDLVVGGSGEVLNELDVVSADLRGGDNASEYESIEQFLRDSEATLVGRLQGSIP